MAKSLHGSESEGVMRVCHGAAVGLLLLLSSLLSTAGAQTAAPPAVLVQAAEMKALARQAEFIGRVRATDKVDLRARVQGFLGPRLFNDGEAVTKGQLLFTIEREPFVAAVDQRKAQLAAANAKAQNAKLQLDRTRELAARDTASQASLDQRIADETQARAAVLEAKAAQEEAEIKLSYTEIRAPIAGRIGRAAVSPGNLVGAESTTLATIVHEDEMYVLFPVTQRELIEARKNSAGGPLKVRVRLADGSLMPVIGRVDFLDVQVDPKTDGQIVRAVFANDGHLLTDGQTVRVLIEQMDTQKSVLIPQAAVATDQAGQYVFVVNADNVVEQRRVRLGDARDGRISVASGVANGERVIVQGQQRVRPGIKVDAQHQPAPTRAESRS
jgi:membrane fusion protein, multidrug efflux system